MSEADFLCNLKTCRRPLINSGCLTSCSHILCEEDGKAILQADGSSKCPVCDSLLPNKYDVVHVNMNPSEEYKSMVLSGLRPEVIMEITGRAMAFWAYQVSSERSHQERAARKALEHAEEIQSKYEVAITTALKQKEAQEKEIENLHGQVQALRDSLAERGRQLQRTQSALTQMRRTVANKVQSPTRFNSDDISPSKSSSAGSSPRDAFFMQQSQFRASTTSTKAQNDSGFTFQPALNAGARGNAGLFPTTKK